jgi:hypothetical protein
MVDTSRTRILRTWRLLAILALVLALSPAVVGRADSHTVIHAGTVTELIAAINTANSTGQEIHLAPNGNYVLTAVHNTIDGLNGLPIITGNVIIQGDGATITRQSGSSNFRIFQVASGATLHVDTLTVSNGNAASGGGISNSGTLSLTNSTVSDNSATSWGGGILNWEGGTVSVTDSTVSGNTSLHASGGGIVSLTDSTVSGNTASSGGGILNWEGGTVSLTNSTVSGNTASSGGGGGILNDATLTLTSSTVSGNDATENGGGILNYGYGTLTLTGSLVAGNTAKLEGPDVLGAVASGSTYNLLGNGTDMSGLTDGEDGNLVGTADIPIDPGFELDEEGKPYLKDNGGPTRTIALQAGSPAIDHIPVGACAVETDQRGVDRPQGTGCDIGAFELEQAPDQPTISDLHDAVAEMDLPRGTERALLSQLGAAGASLERGNTDAACGQLGAFINTVSAQSGKHLTEEQAANLIAAASQIRDSLGC